MRPLLFRKGWISSKEGERLKLRVEKFDISKFWGALGEGFLDEFETFEEEPGWADVTFQDITAYLARHPQRDCQSVED